MYVYYKYILFILIFNERLKIKILDDCIIIDLELFLLFVRKCVKDLVSWYVM